MTFVRIDGVFFFFLLEHRFELTLSCTKPILHAQSFAHVAHAFLNDICIGKLLIQFKHLGKGTVFFFFFFFACKSQTFSYIMKDIAKFYLIYMTKFKYNPLI